MYARDRQDRQDRQDRTDRTDRQDRQDRQDHTECTGRTRPMRSRPQITIDVALLSADFSSFINSLGEVSLIITLYTQHCAGR